LRFFQKYSGEIVFGHAFSLSIFEIPDLDLEKNAKKPLTPLCSHHLKMIG